jgi:phosphoglycolate phosphatase-like HAD superfamily hydrolase
VIAPPRVRALLLDFDGVILQSAALKAQAFADAYAGAPAAKLEAIRAYFERHGGVTRGDKFAHVERTFFGRPGDAQDVARLSAAFRARVFDAVLACDFVPGAQRLLAMASPALHLHVVSGTPHAELREIVERRGLACRMTSYQGAPPAKRAAFEALLREYGYAPNDVVAIGDAITECEAASDLGIPFVGVVPDGSPNPFPAGIAVVPTLEPVPALLRLES